MDLTIYDIIKGPVISSKASEMFSESKKIALIVHPAANKPMIKNAVEKLFNVQVESVRISVRKGKLKRFKRIESVGSLQKKAYITLKPGYSLNFFESEAVGNNIEAA